MEEGLNNAYVFWSQGLAGSSVSIGFEIRKLWKGVAKICISLLLFYPYLLGPDVGPCGRKD